MTAGWPPCAPRTSVDCCPCGAAPDAPSRRAMLRSMRPATPKEFWEQPNGRFVSGRGWLYFGPTPAVAGCVLWGHVQDAAVRDMVNIAPASHKPTAAPHGALLDARRVERADPSAFGIMQRYV